MAAAAAFLIPAFFLPAWFSAAGASFLTSGKPRTLKVSNSFLIYFKKFSVTTDCVC